VLIPFDGLPPWGRSAFFRSFMTLLLGALVFFYIRGNLLGEREKRVISDLKLQALQAQMNPHFIFNALSAIQAFMLKGAREEANMYLTSFSDLMRSYLYASHKRMVSISHEINLLTQYLKLQSLRMSFPFDFEIKVAEEVDVYQQIPALFLQPYVENAVQHGLLNKKGAGKLEIHFLMQGEDALLVQIKDDGIGFAAAEKLKADDEKQHTSMGMSLVRDRQKMIEMIKLSQVKVERIDLIKGEQALGTQVNVRF